MENDDADDRFCLSLLCVPGSNMHVEGKRDAPRNLLGLFHATIPMLFCAKISAPRLDIH